MGAWDVRHCERSQLSTRSNQTSCEPPFPSCYSTMAALARSYQKFLRVAPQAPAIARQMSGGHGGGFEVWKKGFFFAAISIIILGHVNAFGMADESAHAAPEFFPMPTSGSGARSS